MRKIMLSALALMIGAIGFAQNNTSSVTQTGDNNAGFVDQTGSNNTGTIKSVGNLHNNNASISGNWWSGNTDLMLARGITQIGTGNTGLIDQESNNGSVSGESKAGIGQDGSLNKAEIFQYDNTVHSWSSQNVAFVDQLGNNNISLQNQQGRATQSYFRQVGHNNMAESQQSDLYGDFTKAEQVGDNNKSYQEQENGAWSGSKSDIYQAGNFNEANSYQSGETHTVDITQIGVYNMADVSQTGGNGNGAIINVENGDRNITNVTQMGNGNNTWMEIGKWGKSDDNTADFTQVGNGNYLETTMGDSHFNDVRGTQSGNNNYFRVNIKGDSNEVNMSATGSSNRGSWAIYTDWPDFSDGNMLDITQNGDGNITNGKLAGDSNDIDITQTGSGNSVGTLWQGSDGVNILGNMNDVDITQFGQNHSSLNTVTGNTNVILVNQSN